MKSSIDYKWVVTVPSLNENDENEGSVYYMPYPGHAYCVAKAPRYISPEEWKTIGTLISEAPNMLWSIEQLLGDLPSNRNWLNPEVEDELRRLVNRIREQDTDNER